MADIVDPTRLLQQLRQFGPLRRVLLSTAGTLQGTLTAYLGGEVTVQVVRQSGADGHYLRDVELVWPSRGVVACRASSIVTVTDPQVRALVEDERIGIGRMLAHLRAEAVFRLEEVGVTSDEFWRRYRLTGEGFDFVITETFPGDLFPDRLPLGAPEPARLAG